MDSEFPDPEEEYEMRYAEELELMNEMGSIVTSFFRKISFYIFLFFPRL